MGLINSIQFSVNSLRNHLFPNSFYLEEQIKIEKRAQFYKQFVGESDLVFDVGANLGNRVAAFLKLNAKVIAIEPQADCGDFLEYKFGKRITLLRKGMSSEKGKKDIFVSNSSTISSFSEDWIRSVKESGRFAEFSWKRSSAIEMDTLDNVISKEGVPAFIKIDVEGFELEVLKGLNTKVKALSFEYTIPEQLSVAKSCVEYLIKTFKTIEFNYAVQEDMDLILKDWLNPVDMLAHLSSKEFIQTGFGDIYMRII
jgi:FkbM family methyltransferase